jgi:TRAP-type mannitol/chloroaromatic compound transport system permease small subunit
MLKKTLRFINQLSEWSGRVVSLLIYGVLGTLIYEVVARYVFNSPTIWAHETSTFFFGAYFMLGAAYCLRHDSMIHVDILCRRLSPRKQAALNVATFVLFVAVCVPLIWMGGKDAAYSWSVREHTNTTWAPALYPLRIVIPVAASLLFLQGIARFIRDASFAFTGKELKED